MNKPRIVSNRLNYHINIVETFATFSVPLIYHPLAPLALSSFFRKHTFTIHFYFVLVLLHVFVLLNFWYEKWTDNFYALIYFNKRFFFCLFMLSILCIYVSFYGFYGKMAKIWSSVTLTLKLRSLKDDFCKYSYIAKILNFIQST